MTAWSGRFCGFGEVEDGGGSGHVQRTESRCIARPARARRRQWFEGAREDGRCGSSGLRVRGDCWRGHLEHRRGPELQEGVHRVKRPVEGDGWCWSSRPHPQSRGLPRPPSPRKRERGRPEGEAQATSARGLRLAAATGTRPTTTDADRVRDGDCAPQTAALASRRGGRRVNRPGEDGGGGEARNSGAGYSSSRSRSVGHARDAQRGMRL